MSKPGLPEEVSEHRDLTATRCPLHVRAEQAIRPITSHRGRSLQGLGHTGGTQQSLQ